MKRALVGCGGHAKEVAAHIGGDLVFFVDDEYLRDKTRPLRDFDPTIYEVMVAVADPVSRAHLVSRLPKDTAYFTFVHPAALLLGDIEIGAGSFIGAYSVLTTGIKIGNHAILNRGNHVGHDCVLGDYCSLMPGAVISGNCRLGNRTYLGTNAAVRERTSVTDDVTIGMGAAVVSDIVNPGVYVGVPAKRLETRS